MAKKILVVDDETELLTLLQYTLEKAGFEVATCANGREALPRMKEVRPDLLILDVMLPGVDGYSLQGQISEDPETKDVPVLVLTALEPSKSLFAKFPQVAAFMSKPFKNEELVAKVREIVGEDVPADG